MTAGAQGPGGAALALSEPGDEVKAWLAPTSVFYLRKAPNRDRRHTASERQRWR